MVVKWQQKFSSERPLNGGGPQGGTLGIWEYLSQTNNNLDFVQEDEKYKFVDDASALELVNLLSIGLASYNVKQHVPSNIPSHNQIIQRENIKSQNYLEKLNTWSKNHKMEFNLEKTKVMIFNFSKDKQFMVNINVDGKEIEVVSQTKLLETVLSSDLKWDSNISSIVRRANARMNILRKLSEYKPKKEDMKIIYFSYIRSILEQSCEVWHSSLTEENAEDLERIQKNALKIILADKYLHYENALRKLDIEDLKSRREYLCRKFAIKCTSNQKVSQMFPRRQIIKQLRQNDEFEVNYARTERYKHSSIPYMQRQLNK